MTGIINAAIYVRISRDTEREGLGVKRQEKGCRAQAKKLGWNIVNVYKDNDVSATKRRKPRPRYNKMMDAVREGRVGAIVVWDVDRLTRTPRELEDCIDYANKLGLKLASAGGDIDLATEQGRAMARMKGVFAGLEAETIARRQRAKHAELAEAGRYVGPRPFGYRFATDETGTVLTGSRQRLVIEPSEAAVIKECVRRVLNGEGLWSITNDLNSRGVTTSTGNRWQPQPLRRMLLRSVHSGYRKHQEFKDDKWVGPVQYFKGMWEPIIDRETHQRVVAKLTDPSRKTNRAGTELKYLLTWLARCGACGQPLVGTKGYEYTIRGHKRVDGTRAPDKKRVFPPQYKCPHAGCHGVTRRMDVVDEFVEEVVVKLLERDGVRVLGGNRDAENEARVRVDELKTKKALLSDMLMKTEGDGGLDPEQFRRQNKKLTAELEAEQKRLHAAQPADDFTDFTGANVRHVWSGASVAKKRLVIQALAEMAGLTVTIDPVGPGNASRSDTNLYAGIRVESTSSSSIDSAA